MTTKDYSRSWERYEIDRPNAAEAEALARFHQARREEDLAMARAVRWAIGIAIVAVALLAWGILR